MKPIPADVERGRWLFAQPCSFIAAVRSFDGLPAGTIPEIAFTGRSNVGKSSLVNALTSRKTLARTSQTPGRTRQLNFFNLAGRLMLVDLPGYGFAAAAKAEAAAWRRAVDAYLCGRPTLRRVLVLMDGRRGVTAMDEQVMTMLDHAAVSYQTVLTKCDKAAAKDLAGALQRLAAARSQHTALHPEVFLTSAVTAAGLIELRTSIAGLAEWHGDCAPAGQ